MPKSIPKMGLNETITGTHHYEFTIRCPGDVAFALKVDLERLEARYRDTYPVSVESVSLRSSTLVEEDK